MSKKDFTAELKELELEALAMDAKLEQLDAELQSAQQDLNTRENIDCLMGVLAWEFAVEIDEDGEAVVPENPKAVIVRRSIRQSVEDKILELANKLK